MHEHARRLAELGYRAALPALYYAIPQEDRPDTERLRAGNAAEFARMGEVVSRLDDDEILDDMELLVNELGGGSWACVGFCLGGRVGLRATARLGDTLRAAGLLHPSGLVTDADDSPHRNLVRTQATLYLGFGEADHVTPTSIIPVLSESLEEAGLAFDIEILAEADHGFTMPDLPPYNPVAAERAWSGTVKALRAGLLVPR